MASPHDRIPEFSEHDAIHREVIRALKVITGRDFYLTRVQSSSGPLWVYRTEAKRPVFENADILDQNRNKPLDSPDLYFPFSKMSAPQYAAQYGNIINMTLRAHPPLKKLGGSKFFEQDYSRLGHIAREDGDFTGVMDLYATDVPGGDRPRIGVDIEALLALSKKVESDPGYKTPEFEIPDAPLEPGCKEKAEALLSVWADRMRSIAPNPGLFNQTIGTARLIEGIPVKDRADKNEAVTPDWQTRIKNGLGKFFGGGKKSGGMPDR